MTKETELLDEERDEPVEESEQSREQTEGQEEVLSEEEQRYKELYEQLKEELESKRRQSVEEMKITLLKKAGYDDGQAEYFSKFVSGESEKDIQQEITKITIDFSPKKQYVDPIAGNGHKQTPPRKNIGDVGRQIYQRLKDKGKVRRGGM